MQVVGHHLQVEAIKKAGSERELFARSAFNRYYYAVFLSVRSMCADFNPDWAKQPHKNYPDLLKGKIAKALKQANRRANRNSDYELVPKLDSGIRATDALASLIGRAYAIRIVADYQTSEYVDFASATRFSLRRIDITEAHAWMDQVRIFTTSIREAWRQANV